VTAGTRVACDTNVLVSAFIAAGPPSRVIETAIDGSLDLVLLEPSMIELARILSGKLRFTVEHLKEVQTLLSDVAVGTQKTPERSPRPITGDRDDDLILDCAIDAQVDVLVTGDRKHLLPLGEHQGVRILTPQAFLAELRT
jgi:putative PIN family toxin of toxin-antitoxin system